jgi:hypothetical protein
MSKHSPDAIRVAKLLSAGREVPCLLVASSRGIRIYAENFVTIGHLHGLGLCHSPHGAVNEAALTPFGLEVQAVLKEGLI